MVNQCVVNLARTLVHYSTKVREKDLVAIVGQPPATPLIQEVYREVLRCGGYPYPLNLTFKPFLPGFEGFDHIFFREANEDQLQHVNLFAKKVTEEFDVRIIIISSYNTRALSSVDPQRIRLHAQANRSLVETFMRRSASGDLRWVITIYPTQAHAQDAEMSLEEYANFVYTTTNSDSDDPISEWSRIHDEQEKLVNWLKGKKAVRVRGPNIDLVLSIKKREFVNCDGKFNMPDGEIFTGPVEDSAKGWVKFTYPAIFMGNEVAGIELHFDHGKVVDARASKNEALLHSLLDTDEGSRYIGEFAIGTNRKIDRFVKDLLFDEKIGGTIHIALGAGFPETGSINKSAIHWDMICDMHDGGEIYVDEELFYESGNFHI